MSYVPSPAFLPRSSKGRGAFSLLEVAIALVIFVIGAIALLRIFPSGLNVLENSANRRVAAQMSQNVLTSYNSGDLAQTTPDAIYDADYPDSYPSSALGLRRNVGTVPVNTDDFNSSKDAMRRIRGEKQGVMTTSSDGSYVYLNNLARGQIQVSREATVRGVALTSTGLLDFRNAVYSQSNRLSIDSSPTPVRFRQPVIDLSRINIQAATTEIPISGGTATFTRAVADTKYEINFDVSDPDAISDATINSSSVVASTGTGYTFDPVVATKNNLKFTLTISAASITPEANQLATITFDTTKPPLQGISYSRMVYKFLIVGTGGTVDAITSDLLLPVRAPNVLRDGVVYYASYMWNDGITPANQMAVNQPLDISSGDAAYSQIDTGYTQPTKTEGFVPASIAGFTVAPTADVNLRFRQLLGGPVTANRMAGKVPVTTSVPDVVNPINPADLKAVSVDYNVDSWEYIAEDISQFGTPFAGSNAFINTNTPEGAVMSGFFNGAGYTAPIPSSEVREIRTRVGNLRGIVQIKGFYGQSNESFEVTPPFSANSSTAQTASATKALAKQGRLYLPANYKNLSLSHARVYYRSKDAWVQQVGVAASHYIPFVNVPTILHEPWREYVRGTDNFLYFHATDAGKTVEVVHGTTLDNAVTETVEIQPDVLVNTLPAGVPSTFAPQFQNMNQDPLNPDKRSGKTYLARSRDRIRPSTDTIFDVRRPTGTSGISVRTMWLDGTRYAQEIAQ